MVSNINPANPIAGTPTTQSVRDNFQTAHDEITALQAAGPYAPLASPALTGNPTAPTPAPGDNDTSLATTAFVQVAVAPALNNVGRNLLHNSMFNVAQRGAGPWTASGYTLDRWAAGITTDAASFARVTGNDGFRAAIGDEAAVYCLQNVFTGNAGAGSSNTIQQSIEGVRRLGGKTVMLSFWAVAASGTPKLGINAYQYFGTGGSPSPFSWANANGQAVTLSTTWTRYSVAIDLPSTAGKILGTNGDDSTALVIFYSSGATDNVIAGNIGVQSGTVQIWGVQLEIGSVATPLEKPDPQQEIAKCQRFYQTGYLQMNAYGAAGNAMQAVVSLPVVMRAVPTVAVNTSFTLVNANSPIFYPGNATVSLSFLCTAAGPTACVGPFTASADL